MKAGITSHYYNSCNYGGNLQAYALCQVLLAMGVEAEEISIPVIGVWLDGPKKNILKVLFEYIRKIPGFIPRRIKRRKYKIKEHIRAREKAFRFFNQNMIPHSELVYDETTKDEIEKSYDIFIKGSDQVWNVSTYIPAFFLDFVSESKPKISYAASVGLETLSEIQKSVIKKHLKRFQKVSVREKNSVELLKDLSPVEVNWVLDPTCLLSTREWDDICEPFELREKYIFCYFLGDNIAARKEAEKYAKNNNTLIFTIPFMGGYYRECDARFGDISRSDITPGQFIYLLKNAECVFTDSFHATVFSYLYKKQFYVFKRNALVDMSSRVYSFLLLLHMDSRYITEEGIKAVSFIDYDKREAYADFNKMKDQSLKFLKESLACKGNINNG